MKIKEIINNSIKKKVSPIVYFFLSIIIVVTLQVFLILIIRELVDNIFVKNISDQPKLAFWISSFIISLLAMFGFDTWNKNLANTISSNVSTSISKSVYSSVLRSEIEELNDFDYEDITTRVIKDSYKIGNQFIGGNWTLFIRGVIQLLGFFISIMIINPILGLITYAALPVFYMIVRNFDKYFTKFQLKLQDRNEKIENKVNEDFDKIQIIKLKNGIIKEEEEFASLSEEYISIYKTHQMFKAFKDSQLFDLSVGLLLALILGVGGYQSTRIAPIPGTIVAIVIMTPIIYNKFKQLMYNNITYSFIENEIESLEQIMNFKTEFKADPITSFDDVVSFRFDNVNLESNDLYLEELSFDLKKGEKLGVISLDGASNDLIFKLATKLIKPKSGSVSINNCDYSKISTQYLRELITAIPEENKLFVDTIENNITYPNPFDEYKYNDALNKSGLKEMLLDLPQKDQTILDEGLIDPELVQRVLFANAFYKDSKIFILNEATSKLDPKHEEQIIREISKLKNKIIIIMSNKTYNIINCDKILIIDNEKVIEYGAINQLLEDKNSEFNKLIKRVKTTKSAKIS